MNKPNVNEGRDDVEPTDVPDELGEPNADLSAEWKASFWSRSVLSQIRPLTRQLPPSPYVGLFVAGYVLCSLLIVYVYMMSAHGRDVEAIVRCRSVLVMMGVVGYAGFRMIACHPFFNSSYFDWLRLTPWTPPTSLPLGELRITAIDVGLILLAEAAILPAPHSTLLAIPIFYLGITSALFAAALWGLSFKLPAYATLFGLGLVFLSAWYNPFLCLALAIGVYWFALISHGKIWRTFPWQGSNVTNLENPFGWVSPKFGFPFDELAPDEQSPGYKSDRFWGAIVIGWLGMTSTWKANVEVQSAVGGILVFAACLFVPIFRIYVYGRGRGLPRTLSGRFSTGRLIHWSHDKMLVIPLLAMLSGPILAIYVSRWQQVPLLPWVATFALLLLAFGPPSLANWRLSADSNLSDSVHKMYKKLFEQT